jgi:hypothetical protein
MNTVCDPALRLAIECHDDYLAIAQYVDLWRLMDLIENLVLEKIHFPRIKVRK